MQIVVIAGAKSPPPGPYVSPLNGYSSNNGKTIPDLHATVKELFYLALRKFRSTYDTRMLRAGFDVHAVQHRMGHKSLETTMRHLSPAKDVHERLDKVKIAGILEGI